MTTRPRGKVSTPARPGVVTKQVLMGERPLVSGDLVTEAAIVDLHNVYKQFIYEQNQLRSETSKLKGMVYISFVKLFKFAQLLGLVELVREEPMLYPPPGGHLYSVRQHDHRVSAVISNRRIFKLTDVGREDDRSWSDLCRAWREKWTAPQKLMVPVVLERAPIEIEEVVPVEEVIVAPEEIVPEVIAIPKARRGRPPGKRAKVERMEKAPTLRLASEPSKEQYALLIAHLQQLSALGIGNPAVQAEVDKLAASVGDWVVAAIEALEDATSIGYASRVIEFRHLRNVLTEVDEGLLDRDIPRAIESLMKLV